MHEHASELRQDLVSGDWIVIAPKRGFRPNQFLKKQKRIKASKSGCPFENLEKGAEEPLLIYKNHNKSNDRGWEIRVIKNRYPAFVHKPACAKSFKEGPYSVMEGRGYQEVVVTRSHDVNFSHLTPQAANLVFKAFVERYRTLSGDPCLAYISIFQNWGPKAGASIYHPHYQIIGIPVVPPDVEHSLSGSFDYWRKNKTCVHCAMIKFEKNNRKRIIYENKGAIAFAPFVSRQPFEVRIFPKVHLPYLEDTSESNIQYVVDALRRTLIKIEKRLADPDYNFFIHTAPVLGKKNYRHYHWHIEILPKMSIWAGFELGTGIDITVVDPDQAARLLTKR